MKTTLDRIIPKVELQQSGYNKRIATIISASMTTDKNAILRYKRRFFIIVFESITYLPLCPNDKNTYL